MKIKDNKKFKIKNRPNHSHLSREQQLYTMEMVINCKTQEKVLSMRRLTFEIRNMIALFQRNGFILGLVMSVVFSAYDSFLKLVIFF